MNGRLFIYVTVVVLLIVLLDWRKVKEKSARDRAAFVTLLLTGWLLSMLNLPKIPGPMTILGMLFKPLKGLLEQQ